VLVDRVGLLNLRKNFFLQLLGLLKINPLFVDLNHFLKRFNQRFSLLALAEEFPRDVDLAKCFIVVHSYKFLFLLESAWTDSVYLFLVPLHGFQAELFLI
jgi:hypothetical protein